MYHFLVNIFIKLKSQNYALETVWQSKKNWITGMEGIYTMAKYRITYNLKWIILSEVNFNSMLPRKLQVATLHMLSKKTHKWHLLHEKKWRHGMRPLGNHWWMMSQIPSESIIRLQETTHFILNYKAC